MWVLYCSSAILYSGYMHVFGVERGLSGSVGKEIGWGGGAGTGV